MKKTGILLIVFFTLLSISTEAAENKVLYKFDFGSGPAENGYTKVGNETYNAGKGYGIDLGTKAEIFGGKPKDKNTVTGLTSDNPFYFSVDLPEGNYKVTVTLGSPDNDTETLIKAESRRLFTSIIKTRPGQFITKEFVVNVRTPKINDTDSVRLNPREFGKLDWDNKLTIEFNGRKPSVTAMVIEEVHDVVTIFLNGDSTVVDQDEEPWNSWGQMFTRFFDNNVSVANYAESGQALYSSISSRRLAKALSQMKEGDYLFIQFGHNDMKRRGDGIGPWTSYKNDLKKYINAAREKGAIPVLVTQMHRRRFDENGKVVNTHGQYPDAVRQTAVEENVPLIDLNLMSVYFYEALGHDGSAAAFQDGTHHNNYGSYQLAKMVIEGIIQNKLDIAKYIADDYIRYNPEYPDDPGLFFVPESPRKSMEKPLGD
ncbi:MAG: rhamnogalacturonan acetylesterase [Rikenellaceae bacterium]|nr:rhamnogalacturonan acetylesterase [Rikenellaceae bacterium]